MSKMVFTPGAKLRATIQVETVNGTKTLEVGDVLIYRRNFDLSGEAVSIDIQLWTMPLDGKVTLRLLESQD